MRNELKIVCGSAIGMLVVLPSLLGSFGIALGVAILLKRAGIPLGTRSFLALWVSVYAVLLLSIMQIAKKAGWLDRFFRMLRS